MLRLPLVASVPVQAPEAVHDVAFVELQLIVEAVPAAMLVGDALSDTFGGAAATLEPPPQDASARNAPTVRPATTNWLKKTCQDEVFMGR